VRPLVTAIFAVALCLATCSFGLGAWRFVEWSLADRAQSSSLAGVGVVIASACWGFMVARWCGLLVLSYLRIVDDARRVPPVIDAWPHVSILVPAYNEQETIAAALESLLTLDYPDFDVVVIDDGSRDATFERATEFARQHPEMRLRVFRKPNGGKWTAHNFGFRRTDAELILCLDADSRLRSDALRKLVARMEDPDVAAVAGQVRVRNRVNVVTRLQALEYLVANGALRLAQSRSGHVLVVPGPIGLFRRDVMEEVFLRYGEPDRPLKDGEVAGPYEGDTFAEDFDLSVAFLGLGRKIVYEPDAVSDTKAPDNLLALLNQRYRWSRGSMQVIRKFFRRGAANGGAAARPGLYAWVVLCYVAELAMFPFVFGLSLIGLAPALVDVATFPAIAMGLALIWALNASISAMYVVVHRDDPRLILVVPLLDVYFGCLLSAGLVFALIDEARNTRMKW